MNEHDKSMRTQDSLSHLTGRELRKGFNDTDTSPGEMAAWHRYVVERDGTMTALDRWLAERRDKANNQKETNNENV